MNYLKLQDSNLYGDVFDDSNEISNYKWYSDKTNLDKIGINPDGTILSHDDMIYKLTKFKIINQSNEKFLIYKLSNQSEKLNEKNYFTDLIFGEKSNYMIICYKSVNNIMKFSHIIFNGKKFLDHENKATSVKIN